MGDIVEPKTKGDQAEQKAAVAEHRAAIVELADKVESAPAGPPPTKDFPPTREELQLIDRLRKGKAYGRDAYMLEVMLGHKPGNLDYANAMLGVIQHQQGQDSFAQDWSQRLSREQATIRSRYDSLEKSLGEELDETRRVFSETVTRINERIGSLEDTMRVLYSYVSLDRLWQDTPITRRRRRERPAVLPERMPVRPTVEGKDGSTEGGAK